MKNAKLFLYSTLLCCLAFTTSCTKESVNIEEPITKISLESPKDQFLRNFVNVNGGKLSVDINNEDALLAGATTNGYKELSKQIANINKSMTKDELSYWTKETAKQKTQTKSAASRNVDYDTILACDRFLVNFAYPENGKMHMGISQEKAILCGATTEGYKAMLKGIEYENDLIKTKVIAYQNYELSYEIRKTNILKNIDLTEPPITYGVLNINSPQYSGNTSFDGPPNIFVGAIFYGSGFSCSVSISGPGVGFSLSLFGSTTILYGRPHSQLYSGRGNSAASICFQNGPKG